MPHVWILAAAVLSAAAGTGLLRHYALSRNVLDIPNDRSSHVVPTPRGGGVAIVAAFGVGLVALVALGLVARPVGVALLGAGAVVAAVGFLDDHGQVAPRWRLLAHFAAAAWGLAWLGGLPPVTLFGAARNLGLVGDVVATIALVWLLNLYNFMDGIDGLAGAEAVSVSGIAAAIAFASRTTPGGWLLPALLGASCLGFLFWNFPPARIFMGDAGSGFVGLMLGFIALQAGEDVPRLMWSWAILLGVFIVDATTTLVTRLYHGERLTVAHRSHAYQRSARNAGGHRPVTLSVIAINVLWLGPLAALVAVGRLDGLAGVGLAYAPLVLGARLLGAGRADHVA